MNKLPWKLLFFQRIPFKSLKYRRHNPYDSHAPQSVPFNWNTSTVMSKHIPISVSQDPTPQCNADLYRTGELFFTVSPPTVLKSNLCLRAHSPQIMYTLRFAFPPCSSSFSNSNYCNVPVRSFTSKLPAFKQTFVHVTIPHSSSAQCKYFPSD